MTVAELLTARSGDPRPGLLAGDECWSWAEVVEQSARRAALWTRLRGPGCPHIGVLLGNVAEYAFWIGAAALARATIVGINPTRRGRELSDDIRHTDCQLLVTDTAGLELLSEVDTGIPADRILVVDDASYVEKLADLEVELTPADAAEPSDLFLLLFTSGTTGAPKAVRCTQGRLAGIGGRVVELYDLVPEDVCFCIMPLFHGNALMALWIGALKAGACVALPASGKFSASQFLDEVRRYGATYFTYVGKALTYILATPAEPDDADNPLTRAFGNEASDVDVARFEARYGCRVYEGYGMSEGGAHLTRVASMPPGSIGISSPPTVIVADPATGRECPPARFDDGGRLLNPDEAIGEMVNTAGAAGFEGYYDNAEADAERIKNGWYWTGDLGYRDARGYFFFAGRGADWLRVDGENFAAAPVERVLDRFDGVVMSAVYAIPDAMAGDQVMATLVLAPEASFSADDFETFLAAQADLGTKWAPRFVRIAEELPLTASGKVRKLPLRAAAWALEDEVWWRPDPRTPGYRLFTPEDATSLRADFAAHGRAHVAPEPPAMPAAAPSPEPPVAEEPVADELVAEEPVAEEPVAEEPVADEPVADELVAEQPPPFLEPRAEYVRRRREPLPSPPATGWFFCVACGEPLPLPGVLTHCAACGEPLEEPVDLYDGIEGTVQYDFHGLSPQERCDAADLLFQAKIPYRWEAEYQIRVGIEYEPRVDGLFGHDEEESETTRALTVLLEASDRLRADPDDEQGIAELAYASGVVVTADAPHGVNRVRWSTAGHLARQLVDLLDNGAPAEDLATAADILRAVLAQG